MARDRQLPGFLSHVNPANQIPTRAVLTVGALSIGVGTFAINESSLITSVVTFGSLTAYSLLHIAVVRHFRSNGAAFGWFAHRISPCLGLLMLLYALWSAALAAKIIACIWLAIGVLGYRARLRSTIALA
jgi:amino acid transporter